MNRLKRLPISKKISLEELLSKYDSLCRLKSSMTCLALNTESEDFFVAGMTIEFKNRSKIKSKDVILKINIKKLKILSNYII